MARNDSIFELPAPILFAHRGGVREAPEGTEFAFRRALEKARADVLEADLQRTADGNFVVWHGPKLDNMLIEGVEPQPSLRTKTENDIRSYTWPRLDGRAWVTGPPPYPDDLSGICTEANRGVLSLERFLELFRGVPTNLELKTGKKRGSIEPEHLRDLISILDADQQLARRKLVVASTGHTLITKFREETEGRYATSFSAREVVAAAAKALVGAPLGQLEKRALQSSYSRAVSPGNLVERVQDAGGAVHLFLTGFFPVPAIDKRVGGPTKAQLAKVVSRGVDGVMTDRPVHVRAVLDIL